MCDDSAMEVTVESGHIWADDTGGTGKILVLLHPGWGDSTIWLPFLKVLPPGYRVIRYDTRGFGRSPAPAAPFSPVADLTTVLDDRGADRVLLVGHSGGGGTAIGLALADQAQARARVRGLLLLAPGVHDYPWPASDPFFTEYRRLSQAGDRDAIVELGLRTWAAAGADDAARAQVSGAVDAHSRMGGYERPDPPVYDRLGELDIPATVVVGSLEYPLVARCAAQIAARIPGCRQVAAPGADHLLPLRVPELIAKLLTQFS